MKFISWNVNGIRACVQKGFEEFFQQADADIFCIQESKMQEGQLELNTPGYYQYWNYAKKKGYDLGGVIFDGKLGSEKEEPKPEPPKPDDQAGDGQEEGTNGDDKGTQSGDGKEGQSASDEGQE